MKLLQKWVPVIQEDRCSGCGLCAAACGPCCLEMLDEFPMLTLPDRCGSEEHCIAVCQDDAIHMSWVTLPFDTSSGKWREVAA
jgi:MinD superfamily P-loop ATPase